MSEGSLTGYGESWERTDEVVEVGRAETVRVYRHVAEARRTG